MPATTRHDFAAAHTFAAGPLPRVWQRGLAPAMVLLLTMAAASQEDVDKRVHAADQSATKTLMAFAKKAAKRKAMTHSRAAYRLVVGHYDADNQTARTGLGHVRRDGGWSPGPAAPPPNGAKKSQLARVEKEWQSTVRALCRQHRTLGLKLLAEAGSDEQTRHAKRQLELALAFDPDDIRSHKALGHDQIDGFHGTDQQLEFVRNMRSMLQKAKACAALPFDAKDLPEQQMPAALAQSGLPFHGARSEHFEHWVVGSTEQARQSVIWAERALVMVRHLLAGQPLAEQALDVDARSYLAMVRTEAQRDQLLQNAPATRGDHEIAKARLFAGVSYQDQGKEAEWSLCQPADDPDRVVAHVMMRCAAQRLNPGLSEGLVHTLTWMMCGSVKTSYMQLAHTVSSKRDEWPKDPSLWRRRLEAAIESAQDWPLAQIPRERMDNYRDPVRAKAWSFCVWLLARHPTDWLDLCAELNKPNATQEDVDDLFAENLAFTVDECEIEWRRWARRNSAIGKASGWH